MEVPKQRWVCCCVLVWRWDGVYRPSTKVKRVAEKYWAEKHAGPAPSGGPAYKGVLAGGAWRRDAATAEAERSAGEGPGLSRIQLGSP